MVERSRYLEVAADTAQELVNGPARALMVAACRWLGVPRATMYRRLSPRPGTGLKVPQRDRSYPHRLSTAERQQVVARLNQADVEDKSIRQAFHHLLDTGEYLCSLASMHRIMRAAGQSGDRRRQRQPDPARRRSKPVLAATAPRQVWCWDITALQGPGRQSFKLFTMIDLYSRYVVGHRVELAESKELAAAFIQDAVTDQRASPQVIHADNGSPMRAGTTRDLLATLHIHASYSRPRVSNDNPYAESLFKTLKYDPVFPDRFDSLEQARSWTAWFFERYNTDHHHAGLAGHTPARVHDGSWPTTHQTWIATKQAYADRHPERHAKAPVTHEPPDIVWINPPNHELPQTA